jgi:hypothetical protein
MKRPAYATAMENVTTTAGAIQPYSASTSGETNVRYHPIPSIVGNRVVLWSSTSRVLAIEHGNYWNQKGERYHTKY